MGREQKTQRRVIAKEAEESIIPIDVHEVCANSNVNGGVNSVDQSRKSRSDSCCHCSKCTPINSVPVCVLAVRLVKSGIFTPTVDLV